MNRHRQETVGQYWTEQLLADATGNVDAKCRRQSRRHIIVNHPIDGGLHGVAALRLRLPLAEKQSAPTTRRALNPLTIHGQDEQATAVGYGQYARTLVPFEVACNAIAARAHANARRAESANDFDRGAVHGDPMWPMRLTTRQRQPGVIDVRGPLLYKPTTGGIHRNFQLARPGANVVIDISGASIEEERAITVLLAFEHPFTPVLQLLRDIDVGGIGCCRQKQ